MTDFTLNEDQLDQPIRHFSIESPDFIDQNITARDILDIVAEGATQPPKPFKEDIIRCSIQIHNNEFDLFDGIMDLPSIYHPVAECIGLRSIILQRVLDAATYVWLMWAYEEILNSTEIHSELHSPGRQERHRPRPGR